MPSRLANLRRDDRLIRAGRFQRFLRPRAMKVQEPPRLIRRAVDDLWRRNSVAVGPFRVEHHAILLVGKILGDDPPHRAAAKPLPDPLVKPRTPNRIVPP